MSIIQSQANDSGDLLRHNIYVISDLNTINFTDTQNYCAGLFVSRFMIPKVRLHKGNGKPIGFSNAVLLNNQRVAALCYKSLQMLNSTDRTQQR